MAMGKVEGGGGGGGGAVVDAEGVGVGAGGVVVVVGGCDEVGVGAGGFVDGSVVGGGATADVDGWGASACGAAGFGDGMAVKVAMVAAGGLVVVLGWCEAVRKATTITVATAAMARATVGMFWMACAASEKPGSLRTCLVAASVTLRRLLATRLRSPVGVWPASAAVGTMVTTVVADPDRAAVSEGAWDHSARIARRRSSSSPSR